MYVHVHPVCVTLHLLVVCVVIWVWGKLDICHGSLEASAQYMCMYHILDDYMYMYRTCVYLFTCRLQARLQTLST